MNRFEHVLPADFEPFDREEIETSIVARFDYIVRRYESRIAVQAGDDTLTYAGLDSTSNGIANAVLDLLDDRPEPIVLLYRHGARYFEALLGVLKTGKFFASLDADLALDRLTGLISNLETRLIVCGTEMEAVAQQLARSVPNCSVLCPERGSATSREKPCIDIAADSLAYVIYTSGSTGAPEGVMISHRVALHFAMNQTNSMRIRKEDRSLQICPLSSTASTGEFLPILLNGATLLPWRAKSTGLKRLVKWLVEQRVSICTFVPVLFRLLLARLPQDFEFPDVRLIRLSGDRITRSDCILFARHFGPHCLMRAAFGASEANLFSEYYIHRDSLPESQIVPAGYALPDMELVVVDENLNPVPIGEVGEIAVKSNYLSDGYWRNDALSAERFRECPGDDSRRLYLSRDLGYLDGDSCLWHVGRNDSRVKIYGKMVTVSEVESALLEIPGVAEAAVVPVTDGVTETMLVAYYVPEAGRKTGDQDLREPLAQKFPVEVVPKKFIRLEILPTTGRNKVDRGRLVRDWQNFLTDGSAGRGS